MIEIRELRPDDDLAAVLALCKDFFADYEEHHEEFFDTDNLSDADISGRFIQSMESDSSATIVALVDGVIVGYASIVVREQARFYKVKMVGAISALMVAEEHRRNGIATRLLEESEAFFRRHGVKYYTLYTAFTNEPAIKFYERHGLTSLHRTFLGEL